jgi:hypothetical protein
MTAEYRNSKGVWVCPQHKHNESWDCEVLNLLTADMIGLRFTTATRGASEKKDDEPPKPPTSVPKKKKGRLPIYHESPYEEGIYER